MTWRQIKEIVNQMSERQLDSSATVIEADEEGQLGVSYPITDIGTELDETFLTMPFEDLSGYQS